MYNSVKLELQGLREKSQWAGEVKRDEEAWAGPSETRRCQEVYFLSAAVTNYHKHSDESNTNLVAYRSIG